MLFLTDVSLAGADITEVNPAGILRLIPQMLLILLTLDMYSGIVLLREIKHALSHLVCLEECGENRRLLILLILRLKIPCIWRIAAGQKWETRLLSQQMKMLNL